MVASVERLVAFRYLRPRRQEGFVSVIAIFSFLGIMLGVAALIITMSVMNGFTADLFNRILGIGGHIAVEGSGGDLADYAALADRLARVPGVVAVNPVIDGQVLVNVDGRATGAMVMALRREDLAARPLLARRLLPAALEGFADDGIIVGSRLALSLGVHVGDRLTLLAPNTDGSGLAMPRAQSFVIAGLFSVDLPEYDGGTILMPLDTAQKFLRLPDRVTSLDLFVADPDRLAGVEALVRGQLPGSTLLTDWQTRNAALFGAVNVERTVMFVILSLIILVAAFNIICSMIMLVKAKGHDIAILRTMGATRGMILRIFMLSGACIGIVGTLAGFGLGLGIAMNIRAIQRGTEALFGNGAIANSLDFFTQVPPRIEPGEVAGVLVMAFALSLLATIYPSLRAARLDPVEALRYE